MIKKEWWWIDNITQKCIKCGTALVLHENWGLSFAKNSNYKCKKCAMAYRIARRKKQHISS